MTGIVIVVVLMIVVITGFPFDVPENISLIVSVAGGTVIVCADGSVCDGKTKVHGG
jgi:hypothetical protein